MNNLPWSTIPPDNMGVTVRLCEDTALSERLILPESRPLTIIYGNRKIKYLTVVDTEAKRLGDLFKITEPTYNISDIIFAMNTEFEGDSHWMELKRKLRANKTVT